MYKIGDIVVCINNKNGYGPFTTEWISSLTLYKHYKVEYGYDNPKNEIAIENDEGFVKSYYSRRFISVPEYRKQKIEKICQKLEKHTTILH